MVERRAREGRLLRFIKRICIGVIAAGLCLFLTTAEAKTSVPATETSPAAASLEIDGDGFLIRLANRLNKTRRISTHDSDLYRTIFELQKKGEFVKANAAISDLEDHRLIGHVLRQRYLHADYKAGYDELATWMRKYADHAGAQDIFDLALKRKGKNDGATLVSPKTGRSISSPYDIDVGPVGRATLDNLDLPPRARDIVKSVNEVIADYPTRALTRLNVPDATKVFPAEGYDALRGDIATAYFFNGKTDKAFMLASASADRSGTKVPAASWIAGLSAWKMERYETAAKYFEITANSSRASAWTKSAASYWAARSWLRARHPEKVSPLLIQATEYPRSFYGIIAVKALGMEQVKFNWKMPRLQEEHIDLISKEAAGRRAIALVDAAQRRLAESELRQVNAGNDEDLQEALIAYAREKGMPGLLMRMGGVYKNEDGKLYDGALYPETPWAPKSGVSLDYSLIYAFVRQESQFNPQAENKSSGAQGLMQLMPSTARHMADGDKDDLDLLNPYTNIKLGEAYLKKLLLQSSINGNLFRLALAYNAGPGKLARFQQLWDTEEDPLLFIETFPVAETRMFVERVLANYWIYRVKYGLDTNTLDATVRGDWPVYKPKD